MRTSYIPGFLLIAVISFSWSAVAQDRVREAGEGIEAQVRQLLVGDPERRHEALTALTARGNPDVAAALIQTLRYFRDDDHGIRDTLEAVTKARPGEGWEDWMLWQEAHPEIESFEGFDAFKADLFSLIDVNFRLFLRRGVKH